ncbi:MAG: hypothetical protein EOM84_01175 [Sphingobacteriia bacterium]|nr:hypothetical protein [Sphingobacteriia bacterium]
MNLKRTLVLGFFVLAFLLSPDARAESSYWKNYFSSEERKAVVKNAEKYTIKEIKTKSKKWKGIIRGYNIKNGTISDEDIKDNGISTDKISGLRDYVNEKIQGSSTPQDFSADNLTGTYAALDGSQITGLNPGNISIGSLNLGGGTFTAGALSVGDITSSGRFDTITMYSANGPIINVKHPDFGAIGNGLADDTIAIQTALDTAGINSTTVFLPKGIYRVSNLNVPSNVIVQGEGQNSTIIKLLNSATGNCLSVSDSNNVIIRDLQLDGNRVNNSTNGDSADSNWNGIWVNGATDIIIERVYSRSNGYHGIIMVNVSRIRVIDCHFEDNGYRPIHGHAGVYDVIIRGCQVAENGKGFANQGATPYDGIFFFDNVRRLVLSDNVIRGVTGSNPAIEVGGIKTGTTGSSHITIKNNIIDGNSISDGYGISLTGPELTDVIISGNVFTNILRGILAVDNYGVTTGMRFSITGNTFENCTSGILFYGGISKSIINGNVFDMETRGFGIKVKNLSQSTISGNTFTNAGTWTPSVGNDCIILEGTSVHNVITGNLFHNDSVGHCANYGVNENSATCNYNYITGNHYYQMVTANNRIQGANTQAGIDGTFVDVDGSTIGIANGIITSKTAP